MLKGGMLLAVYELRRPTADVDLAALHTSNEVEEVRQLITEVAATVLPAGLDDGLTFDLTNVTAEAIRDEDEYSGVRVRLLARLATAREPFHVDVNIGDPIWPVPAEVSLPRLLEQEPIQLRGYPMEMVLAEKIVTALERGPASTRWRDFGDIYLLAGRYAFQAGEMRQALRTVADHRRVDLAGLDDALDGYAEIGNQRDLDARRVPAGQDRKAWPLEVGRRADSGQDVGAQGQVQHLLLDDGNQRGLPGLHPGELRRGQAVARGSA